MKKIYVLIFISAVVAVSFLYFFRNEQLKGIVLDASYPVFKVADTVEGFFLSVFKHFQSQSRIIEENRQLQKKIELLKARIIQLKKVETENKRLKRLLQFTDKYPDYRLRVARIIGYSPDNWRNLLLLMAGSFDGIKREMLLYLTAFYWVRCIRLEHFLLLSFWSLIEISGFLPGAGRQGSLFFQGRTEAVKGGLYLSNLSRT
ncbi:MAG: rod shape-determining protein MreC [Persephonella sp.]|nr:rod shape-determining protein MreC [Persephonella sp.]